MTVTVADTYGKLSNDFVRFLCQVGCWLTPLRRILVSLSHHPKISPTSWRSMRSMRSMRGGSISRSRGPLQKACHGPARMSGHNCLPGPQTVCIPGGRPHEQKTKRFHGWMAVQAEPTQLEPPTRFPSRLDYYSCPQTLHPIHRG